MWSLSDGGGGGGGGVGGGGGGYFITPKIRTHLVRQEHTDKMDIVVK